MELYVEILCVASYQSSAAEEDHEDNKGLKPTVLHYLEAGLPQPPPDQA